MSYPVPSVVVFKGFLSESETNASPDALAI
jgi:hypothetical protein